MPKLQITLTTREADLLSKKANELGYGLVKYVKFLLGQEAIKTAKENGGDLLKSATTPKNDAKPVKVSPRAANDALKELKKLEKEAKAMQDINQNPAADQGTGMPAGDTPAGSPSSPATTPEPMTPVSPTAPEPVAPVTPTDTPAPTPEPAPTAPEPVAPVTPTPTDTGTGDQSGTPAT